MTIEIAADTQDKKKARMQALQAMQPETMPRGRQDGPLTVAGNMVTQKAMQKGEELANPYIETAFTKGKDALMGMFAPAKTGADAATLAKIGTGGAGEGALIGNALTKGAATGAAGSGLMAGLGTAMPYLGAGLIAGKALGFFNEGGPVDGPLAIVEDRLVRKNIQDEAKRKAMQQALARRQEQEFTPTAAGK